MRNSPPLDEMNAIADSSAPLRDRADAFLGRLRGGTTHDAAWLSVSDHRLGAHAVVGTSGLDRSVTEVLERQATAGWTTAGGASAHGPPLRLSDLPGALPDGTLWDECLAPAGFRGGVGAVLRDASGDQTGFLALLHRDRRPSTEGTRLLLERLAPVVTRGLSPMHSLLGAARMVPDARAGVALVREGGTCTLPGMADHPLLRPGSPVVRAAARGLAVGQVSRSFLWPTDGTADGGHVRLTVLATSEVSRFVRGLLLLTAEPDCLTLTPRELEVLGLLTSGASNQQISRSLAVTLGTVATHVEHVMRKLDAPSRTLAAVRAEREGLYVPPRPRGCDGPR